MNTAFELISRQMFLDRGLDASESFLLASKLKYGAYSHSFVSQKHDCSKKFNAWLDRVLEECAKLEVLPRGHEESFTKLSEKTGHSLTLQSIQKEEDKIQELISIVKSERTKGFLACKSCKSMDSVQIDQKQTRSSDEPMTLFALCDACGFQWTVKT
jgi:DNA-directed RNA polymerase subunit M/transcription elongation factor TFIIS